MKHLSLTCISILPALAVTASASAQFSVQHLGTFGPAVCFEMNDSGQIAGDYQFMALTTPMRFTPGVGIEARSTPAGSGLGYALGINNAGACIGMLDMPGPATSAAVIWDANNVMTELPLPAGSWTYNTGVAINDSNVACGYVTLALVGDDLVSAWRWDAVNGYTVLPHLAGNYAYSGANDMNASGVICGISRPAESAPSHAVIWDASSQVTEIPLLPGATSNTAWAINDAGVVVGDSSNGTPWRYTPGVGVVALAKFGTQPAVARGVNNAGWVVGYAMQSGEPRTVVWDPAGVIYKLEDYLPPNGYYFPSDGSVPIAISNNNDLVVRAMDFAVSGDPRAVRFHFGFPAPDCPGDINDSGTIDVNDLLAVITTWGACADPKNCPADIVPPGGNDMVDVNDLLAVITTWGPCQ